ncbi:MAG TPA: ATP-binding protein, partial [Prosthecobacter sp.]|nr:ATP-binding protein [Prosthecobacter sp.]
MPHCRIFISTVSHEFLTCRERLATDLRFPDVDVQTQEQNVSALASGQTILIKLDDYIAQCDAVIHLIGRQTSKDGRVAGKEAVDDLLQRHAGLPDVVGLQEDELRTLSYTQWEAWLAYYHRKTKRPELKLIVATPSSAFVPDHPADAATAHAQKLSQAWHEKELKQRGRYSEISFAEAKDLSIAVLRALKAILPAQQPPQRIATTRLISRHTAADFLGRDKELALLDDAWNPPPAQNQEQGTTNLLSIIAWGGVGKTALLAYWVRSRFTEKGWLNAKGQPDPLAYFDWTFYDQGTRGDDATHAGAASLGSFFQKALEHFGDPEPENPEKKAARLARHLQAQRSLLILDGLEPLQYPPNHPQAGQLTDPDLRELLGLLAQRNPGLCLISSRQPLTDLPSAGTSPTRQHDLEELPLECAVSLLRKMQITGTEEELQQAATDYFCHALSLIVLGRFLFVKGGDIRLRSQLKLERANDNRNQRITRNAWHILEAYEQWLASPQGHPTDVQALRLTGLFDRPASADCLAALRRAPAIPGLTDALVPLNDDAWNAVLLRLHEAHLIQLRFPPVAEGSFAPRPEPCQVTLDAHPLIREYFAKQLRGVGKKAWWQFWRSKNADAFKMAHSRLFDHLCQSTEHRPDTLEGLQPLYQAVVHGCLAGRQQEAVEKVYDARILRGTGPGGFYSRTKLGAIGADLGAVAAFFDPPWSRLSPNLSEADQAWLLNEAALRLRALGRLTEAREPMRVTLEINAKAKQWENAAAVASNLSELEVTLGLLGEAVATARRAIEFADQSRDAFQRMINRTTAADALHQSGQRAEARGLFEQAETLQRERQPQFDLLYSLQGFRYSDLILAEAERAA